MYKSIAISGQIASGTTTAGRNAAEKLNLKFESAGDFFRKYMLDNNIPLWDKAQIPDEIDRQIDKKLTELAQGDGSVIDAHYIAYLTKNIPQVLKILLICENGERYKRALSRKHTHTETIDDIKKREEGLDAKFRKLYANENFLDPKFFDLVIDTTNTRTEEVTRQISKKFLAKNQS